MHGHCLFLSGMQHLCIIVTTVWYVDICNPTLRGDNRRIPKSCCWLTKAALINCHKLMLKQKKLILCASRCESAWFSRAVPWLAHIHVLAIRSHCSSAVLKLWLLPLPLKGWASGLGPHTQIQCLSGTLSHIADQRHYLSIRSHSRGWGLWLRSVDWEGGVEFNPFQTLLFKKQFVFSEKATKNMFSLLQYEPGSSTMPFQSQNFLSIH